MNAGDPKPYTFPSLPIVTPDPPRKTQAEKYGSLFYAGIAGLAISVALVGWFGYRAWLLRDIWTRVYVLHDDTAPLEKRLQAACDLGRDPRVEQRQLWEMSLRRKLPELARYIMAEGVSDALVAEDPQAFTLAVARSPDWPDWLRMAMARPLAYASTRGHDLSRETLNELTRRNDPILRTWTLYALAVQNRPDPQTLVELQLAAKGTGPDRELAEILLGAVGSDEPGRLAALDRATAWLRAHYPDIIRLWNGWTLRDGKVAPSSA